MNILNFTRRIESWQPDLASGPRDQILDAVLERLCADGFSNVNPELTHAGILQALVDRETQRTTAVGRGIAFPHARLDHLSQALFAVATFEEPVMFDEFPVRIVCLILVPSSEPTVSLKIMAQLSQILINTDVQRQVLDAQNPDELRTVFKAHNPRIDKPIIARDIMRPPRFSALETDLVSKCSHLMSINNLRAIPVVNERKEILGEITVEHLFRYGLPDFFSKLKSVSFIAEFDPFEKYFTDERDTQICELMDPNVRMVPPNYTIMEIVFDLAIKSYPKLYVIEDGRWIGTIDKGLVLDNVINH